MFSPGPFIPRCCSALLVGLCVLWPSVGHSQQTLSGRIIGRVVDHEKGTPIPDAELRIRGTGLLRVSGPGGRFVFEDVPSGPRVLEVTHLSYWVRTDSIRVIGDETLEVEIQLAPDPLPLEPLVVSIRSKVLETSGFYRRRDQGLSGTMFVREDIEERNPSRLTDLFHSIPGVRVVQRDGVAGPVVVVPRGKLLDGGTDSCYPPIWMDGIVTNILDMDLINPDHIEGLEVYVGARTPLRYNSDCGAILVWTRVPVKRGGR
ncbi:carboxypeptidase-like regulatory domain-containing protein [Gemmatimonadota bacterium]